MDIFDAYHRLLYGERVAHDGREATLGSNYVNTMVWEDAPHESVQLDRYTRDGWTYIRDDGDEDFFDLAWDEV
mgnify:CR=1 FL=1